MRWLDRGGRHESLALHNDSPARLMLVRTAVAKVGHKWATSATLVRMAEQGSAPDEKSFHDVASRRDVYELGDVFEVKK